MYHQVFLIATIIIINNIIIIDLAIIDNYEESEGVCRDVLGGNVIFVWGLNCKNQIVVKKFSRVAQYDGLRVVIVLFESLVKGFT